MSRRRQAAWIWIALCATLAVPAYAVDGDHFGPLRTRDLSPFGYLRLDLRPAPAVQVPADAWLIETQLSYQNTWALSPRVERYLKSLPQRRELTPADVETIRALPGENYLVDMEMAQLDVLVHRRLAPRWTGFAILSGVSYQGGFLDSTVEQFHESFNFASFGRDRARRDDFNVILDLASGQRADFEPAVRQGLLDPTLGVRYALLDAPQRWNVVAEAAVKVPLAGRRAYLSTGNADAGLQVSLQRFAGRQAFYLNAAGVYYDGGSDVPRAGAQLVPTLVAGYELALTPDTHAVAQVYASRSLYTRADTALRELLRNKYQVSFGLYHRAGGALFSLAMTENLVSDNSTPDVGFQFGWTHSLRGAAR